ncbi:MAG TPA: hypothetical protein VFZ62_03965 [Candidatus Saccharimonadales bacterium]
MPTHNDTAIHKEYVADLLKERIYATLALLAVLISIDSDHYSPLKALLLIYGTILSLWAASIVATQMSRRVVFGSELDTKAEQERQLRRHAPMLATLAFPTLMIGLSMTGLVPLGIAVDISIISALILLAAWSVSSARSLHITKLPIFLLVIIELLIGLGVVGLKVLIGH